MLGQTVWKFDSNHRVYRRSARRKDGYSVTGAPVWRRHWVSRTITGETSRSWITNRDEKIPKKGRDRSIWAFSEAEIEDRAWIEDHIYPLTEHIRRVTRDLPASTLRDIAALVGYVPKPPKVEGDEYCWDCDGVGWVEGGEALRTNCRSCRGTGFKQ